MTLSVFSMFFYVMLVVGGVVFWLFGLAMVQVFLSSIYCTSFFCSCTALYSVRPGVLVVTELGSVE